MENRAHFCFDYHLRDIDEASWSRACDELAPAFAAVPGLVSKVWLHGEGDARGGVYLWVDTAAYEDFLASSLGAAVGSHPKHRRPRHEGLRGRRGALTGNAWRSRHGTRHLRLA